MKSKVSVRASLKTKSGLQFGDLDAGDWFMFEEGDGGTPKFKVDDTRFALWNSVGFFHSSTLASEGVILLNATITVERA